MWHFFTVALVPDLVRWRWGPRKKAGVSDRWITGGYRGRNAFGRLWWRCEVLLEPDESKPYRWVHGLGEDELVQIMERTLLAGNRLLSRKTAYVLITIQEKNPKINRALLLREYQKRMLRLGAFTEFQALDDKSTRALAIEVMNQTIKGLRDSSTRTAAAS